MKISYKIALLFIFIVFTLIIYTYIGNLSAQNTINLYSLYALDFILLFSVAIAVIIIHKRKEKQTKSRISEINELKNELESVFNSSPSIMIIVDRDRKVIKINDPGSLNSTFEKDKTINLRVGDVLSCINSAINKHECEKSTQCDSCPLRSQILSTFENNKNIYRHEAKLNIVRNNIPEKIDIQISTILLKESKLEKVLLVIDDISKQIKTQEELKQAIEKYKFLSEVTHEGVIVNENGIIKDMNSRAAEIFDYTKDELIEKDFIKTVLTPEYQEHAPGNLRLKIMFHSKYWQRKKTTKL